MKFAAWTYNGRIPGPTLRATEGDRLRIRSSTAAPHPHTIHFHGIHPAAMDGVAGLGAGEIAPGGRTSTSSTPRRSGCTSTTATSRPLAEHIAKGLYGAFIIDPKDAARATPTRWSWS